MLPTIGTTITPTKSSETPISSTSGSDEGLRDIIDGRRRPQEQHVRGYLAERRLPFFAGTRRCLSSAEAKEQVQGIEDDHTTATLMLKYSKDGLPSAGSSKLKTVGSANPKATQASIAAFAPAMVVEKLWVLFLTHRPGCSLPGRGARCR